MLEQNDGELVQIHFLNLSERTDEELLPLIQEIVNELELNQDIRFIFQRVWTNVSDNGEIIPNAERESAFDGDSYDTNVVRVQIRKDLPYPLIWNINSQLEGEYLRNVNFFNNETEFFIYFAAHELRHLWQWQNQFKSSLINELLEMDDECDADFYATRRLSQYRATN